MTIANRIAVGCAALAAGLWLVASPAPAPAGTPDLPTDAYKKAAEADIKFLQKRVEDLAKSDEPAARSAKPGVGAALLVAAYADVLGDKELKDNALKIGTALNDKKYKDAAPLAQKLTLKPGAGKAGIDLPKLDAFEKAKDKDVTYLPTTMKLYSNAAVLKLPSGMNIEKDLKAWTAKGNPPKLDLAEVELLVVRSAVINQYALENPNEKARNAPDKLKEWQALSKKSVDLSKEIIAETGKKAPDLKAIRTKLTLLEAACTDCHGKFRFDE